MTHTQKFNFLTFIISLVICGSLNVNAQVQTAVNYYYNNFDGGEVGEGFKAFGERSLDVMPNSLGNTDGYALKSTGSGKAGGYALSFLPAGSNLNNEEFGFEWTLLYRNNGGNPDQSQTIDNNANAWRYWLYANNSDLADMQGYYLTQTGTKLELHLRTKEKNSRCLLYFDLSEIGSNNTTYAIRVQRIRRDSQYVWQLFVDPYTESKTEATTPRDRLNYEANVYNTYQYSGLEVVSTSADRFVFDEVKLYSMKLNITGANDTGYGISNPLSLGKKSAAIYGLEIKTRGYFDISQLSLSVTGNLTGVVEGTMKLNKSKDSFFGNADDQFVANLSYYDTEIQNYTFSDAFYSMGEANGEVALATYYFITVDVKDKPVTGASFAISKFPVLKGISSQLNYANTIGVVAVTTAPNATGNTFDWFGGTSTEWANSENWEPNGVPRRTDLARIGVKTFINQPMVDRNITVGNILFGQEQEATLTVKQDATLTVNNNIEYLVSTVIAGDGALMVKGSLIAKPTINVKISSAIASLTVQNLILDSQNGLVSFFAQGKNTTVTNAVQTAGEKTVTIAVETGAQLTLTGATPFNLAARTHSITNATNSAVVYNAAVKQKVSTNLSYQGIVFTGAGTKEIAPGVLTVVGNWMSTEGKIDFKTNNSSLKFSGKDQIIEDKGSEGGNGLAFANVLFSEGGVKNLSTGRFSLGIGNYLSMGENTILQTNDNLTFRATSKGSASIDVMPATAAIKGQVTVEKFIQGGSKDMWRTNRMLSSPVYDNTADFTNSGNRTYSFTQFVDDMIITGKNGKANGFDVNAGNTASAWTYMSGKSFVEIPNINTSLNVGNGAFIFFRGNREDLARKVTSPFMDAESITMTFKGVLNQQDVNVPLGAFNLLGNPYAATIDWKAVRKIGNVEAVIRAWNPSMRQYSHFNGEYGTNGGTRYIGPGQAFFVAATGANPAVIFTEESKVNDIKQGKPLYNVIMSANETNIYSNFASTPNSQFTTVPTFTISAKLKKTNTDHTDEALMVLRAGELAIATASDVPRLGGEAVFLSSLTADGKQMAINYLPTVELTPTVKLGVNVQETGNYELLISPSGLPVGYEVKLKDHFLNTLSTIDASATNYTFSIDKNDKASADFNRFEIMFSPATTLPLVASSFIANKTATGVTLKWATTASAIGHFVVQRSGEDKVFTTIGSVAFQQNGNYTFDDRTPINGYNYYRLMEINKDGASTINNPIAVNFELNTAASAKILVYPTTTNSNYTLKYNGALTSANYQVKISNVTGKLVASEKMSISALENGYQGAVSALKVGVYFIQLVDVDKGESLGVAKLIKK